MQREQIVPVWRKFKRSNLHTNSHYGQMEAAALVNSPTFLIFITTNTALRDKLDQYKKLLAIILIVRTE